MILLDTHVVIWLMTSPKRISRAAAAAIEESGRAGSRPAVSAVTLFEIAYLRKRSRIQLQVSDTLLLQRLHASFHVCPITDTIAIEAARLPEPFHGDPLDRMIAATAIVENGSLLTADAKILASGVCKVVW